MTEIDPRILSIPRAVARKFAARAKQIRMDVDELESIGNLALAKALARFDPTKGSSSYPFCLQRVKWAVYRVIYPDSEVKLAEIGTISRDALESPGECVEAPAGASALEASDEAAAAMSRLSAIERRLVEARAAGLDNSQIAEAVGYCKRWVEERFERIRAKSRRAARTVEGHARAGYRPCPTLTPAWRERGRAKREAAKKKAFAILRKSRRLAGHVRKEGWYVVSDVRRECWGDYDTPQAAAEAIGVDLGRCRYPFSAPLAGFPELTSDQSLRLVRLLVDRGPLSPGEMTEHLGVNEESVRRLADAPRRLGLIRATYRGREHRVTYEATEDAIGRKPVGYRLALGASVVASKQQGYAVLPPILLKGD